MSSQYYSSAVLLLMPSHSCQIVSCKDYSELTMEGLFTALGLLLVAFLYCIFKGRTRRHSNARQIPGPRFFEGVKGFVKGNLQNNLHLQIQKWVQIYGPVMKVNLGISKIIFFNDTKTFNRIVNDSSLSKISNDRPPTFVGKYIFHNNSDIVFENLNKEQKGRRKIFHSSLKFYGEGVSEFEALLNQTLNDLKGKLSSSENVNICYQIRHYILNLLQTMLTGETLANVDGSLDVMNDFNEAMNKFTFETDLPLTVFPYLRFIPWTKYKLIVDNALKAKEKFHKMHFGTMKNTYVAGERRGMIDDLIFMEDNYLKHGGDVKIDEDVVKSLIQNMVVGGNLTTANTICVLILNLIIHQDIQEQLYKEINEVMGDNDPSMEHIKQLPYVAATIQETLRIHSLAPFLLPHTLREDVVSDGFFFPKGSVCMMNAWHSHHNEDTWKDPWNFRPDRFLDENGQFLEFGHPLRDELIPFGKGRRSCPGESFARFRLFIILTTLVKSFVILPPDPPFQLPSADPRNFVGLILGPADFMCKVVKRCF